MHVFYRPADGFVGDVIPFYWRGAYHAFYLKAPLPPKRHGADGTPYAHVASRDLVNWEEWPPVIEPGPPGAPDEVSCFTGTVIERDGLFHLFYTGYRGPDLPQTICRATSHDLRTWQKDPANPILSADPRWYEPIDWRDPFPFWNEEAGEYWMLLAAREKDGPSNRRGCIALATSPDLETWAVQPPFWSPRLYFTHECPDLFRWGDQWVLVYSTFSERHVTHYRLSDSLRGPWLAPNNDTFDGRAFYAAKTAGDGTRRFAFGWNPTRAGETDDGKWDWAGSMVVHELHPGADGGITVKPPSERFGQFPQPMNQSLTARMGEWQQDGTTITASFTDGFATATLGELPDPCRVTCRIACAEGTRAAGLLLRANDALEGYYQLRWEPNNQRVVLDRWPRPGDVPFMLERPVLTAGRALELDLYIEGTALVVYCNGAVALSCRMYDHPAGQLGLFVAEGSSTFADVSVYRPAAM